MSKRGELVKANDKYIKDGFYWSIVKGRFGFYHYVVVHKMVGVTEFVRGRRFGYWNSVDRAEQLLTEMMNE